MITRPVKNDDLLFSWLPKDILNMLFEKLDLQDALSIQGLGIPNLNRILQDIWKKRFQRHFQWYNIDGRPDDTNWPELFKNKTATDYYQLNPEIQKLFYLAKEGCDDELLRVITAYQQLQGSDRHFDTLVKIARRNNKQTLLNHYYKLIAAHYQSQAGEHYAREAIDNLTLLQWAIFCRSEKVTLEKLLADGANLAARTASDETNLKLAAQTGNVGALHFLIEHCAYLGSEKSYADISDAIIAAIESYHPECIPALINYAVANNVGWNDVAALGKAVEMGFIDVIELLIAHGADIHATHHHQGNALHTAIELNRQHVIDWLLDHGADIHVQSHAPHRRGATPIIYAVIAGNLALVQRFLNMGISVDACDLQGHSLVHLAATRNYLYVLKLLIRHHAKIDLNIGGNTTPLHAAASMGHEAICEELIKHHANITAKDKDNKTPLELAREHGHPNVVNLILRYYPHLAANTPVSEPVAVQHSDVAESRKDQSTIDLETMLDQSSVVIRNLAHQPVRRFGWFARHREEKKTDRQNNNDNKFTKR